ncbi:MAG: hypothetical protein WC455_22580 [Dehalococcoidia bacterium]
MSEIQRYDCEICDEYARCEPMRKAKDGDWVTYDDHAAALAAERQRIIDEMVTPLMKYLTEVREYKFFNGDTFVHPFRAAIDKLLVAVEAKLKEIKG